MTDDLLANLMEKLSPRKSPLSSDAFATPGGGARPVRTIPAYNEGLELSHLIYPEKVCLGLIGTTKVCCIARDRCTIASHRTRRASGMDGSAKLLVRHTSNGVEKPICYLSPCLPTSQIADDLVLQLLSMTDTDWGPTFSLIGEGNIEDLADYDNKQDLMRTTRKAMRAGDTPFKVQGRVSSLNVLDSIMELVEALRAVPSLVEKVDNVDESDTEDRDVALTVALRAIAVRLDFLGKACQAALSGVNRVGHDAQNVARGTELSLEGISAEVDILKGLIGERGYLAGPSEPTLWGAANGLGSRLGALETAAGLLHANMENLRSFADGIDDRLGKAIDSSQDTSGTAGGPGGDTFSADSVMRDILNSPSQGTAEHSGGRYVSSTGILNNSGQGQSGLNIFGTTGTGAGGRGGGPSGSGIQGNVQGGNNPGGIDLSHNFSSNGLGVPGGNAVDPEALSLLSSRVSKLEQKDGRQGVVEAVYFGDHFFGSEHDALAFIEKHLGVGSNIKFGALTSPYHILALLYKNLSGKNVGIAELASLKKLNLGRSELDAFLAASVELPEIFTATTKLSGHSYKSSGSACSAARFKVFPSHSDWGNEGDETSLYEKVLRALRNVEDQVNSQIRTAFRESMEMKLLAINMLNTSTKFLRDLFSYCQHWIAHSSI